MKKIKQKIILISLMYSAAFVYAEPWVNPTQNAPSGNVSAPVNISGNAQVKSGPLGLSKAVVTGESYLLGNVGIGTSDPKEKLEVKGNARIDGGYIDFIKPKTVGGWARGLFYKGLNSSPERFAGIGVVGTDNTAGYIYLGFDKKPWATIKSLIIKPNGSVGIGTLNPSSKLEIVGDFKIKGNTSIAPFKFYQYGSSVSDNHLRIGTDIGHYGDSALEIYQSNTNNSSVNPGKVIVNGNLGVGTSNPKEKLEVNGNITNYSPYTHPSCNNSWRCISSYVFTSRHYYGSSDNTPIYYGEFGNVNIFRGKVAIGSYLPSAKTALHVFHLTTNTVATLESGDADVHLAFKDSNSKKGSYITGKGDSLVFETGGYNDRVTIKENGYVGIGTSNPLWKLDVSGSVKFADIVSGGKNSWIFQTPDDGRKALYISPGTNENSWKWSEGIIIKPQELIVANIVKAKSYLHSSDRKLKKNIEKISGKKFLNILNKNKINGYTFNWRDNNKKDSGLIAQEIEKYMPELVLTDKETNFKSVNYDGLIAPLIEAVKEQQKTIEKLENRIKKLEKIK